MPARTRFLSFAAAVAVSFAPYSRPVAAEPSSGAKPASDTLRWNETVRWSGSVTGAGGSLGSDLGNLDVCPPGACDDHLLDIQVKSSPSRSNVRFVQLDLSTTARDSVDVVVFPPGADPSKDGTHYVREAVRLIDPRQGIWRIQARCWDVCVDGSFEITATTGAMSVPRAVAHRAGGVPTNAPGPAPWAGLQQVGSTAYGPTLASGPDGTLFYQAQGVADQPVPKVLRSRDGGASWQNVSPTLGRAYRHPVSQDSYVHVDEDTGRLFTIDQVEAPCVAVSASDDQGDAWTTSASCHDQSNFMSLITGPPVSSTTIGYPNVAYMCGSTYGGVSTSCSKSLDGGRTFVSAGQPAFVSVGPVDQCGFGAVGHGVAGSDGTLFLPRGYCGQPWLAMSRDEGSTWTRVKVASNGIASDRISDQGPPPVPGVELAYKTAVAVDEEGTLYYVWSAADRLPYLAISRDGGLTWSKPKMIAPPGVNETVLPSIDVGAPGRIAVSYMGTEESPGAPFPETREGYDGVRWNGYLTVSVTALQDDPVFLSAPVNVPADPLVIGFCGAFECPDAGHYFDVEIDARGTPHAAFVDVCVVERCDGLPNAEVPSEAVLSSLVGGPSLR